LAFPGCEEHVQTPQDRDLNPGTWTRGHRSAPSLPENTAVYERSMSGPSTATLRSCPARAPCLSPPRGLDSTLMRRRRLTRLSFTTIRYNEGRVPVEVMSFVHPLACLQKSEGDQLH